MFFDDRLELFHQTRVINWHDHVWYSPDGGLREWDIDRMVAHARLLGISKTIVSLPDTHGFCTPERVERANNVTIKALEKYPDDLCGYVYIDPIMGRYALYEIDRCVQEHGFIGVKLYHQFAMDDPAQYPIIEKCIELDIPILMHAGKFRDEEPYNKTKVSNSTHMIAAAKRYPEATFQMAHIGGGGDWYWQLKGMEEQKNIFIDISGSVHDSGMIEKTVKTFGAERVLFATDGSYSSSIGKLLSARITDDEIKTILDNPTFARYLERGARK